MWHIILYLCVSSAEVTVHPIDNHHSVVLTSNLVGLLDFGLVRFLKALENMKPYLQTQPQIVHSTEYFAMGLVAHPMEYHYVPHYQSSVLSYLQCFDTVGWASGT